MAKHDTQNVSYMRKDTHFLADGTWYVSTPCPKCGLVDEEVSWEEAKTPHHAGLIADQRHAKCVEEMSEQSMREAAAAEIVAAENQLEQQIANLKAARQRVREFGTLPKEHPLRARLLEDAMGNLKRHEQGLVHAQRRARDIREHNTPRKP